MMPMPKLMVEASRRYRSGPGWAAVVNDAADQGRHGMDAPDTVEDGVEYYVDEEFSDVHGPVPRVINLRDETP